jgi:dTDP-4-amino-4,6-dideoxygalactose transaminase
VDASERVVMVPSGTAALEMAALLCELTAGDEVIMPSYTFSSTANCFVLRGATPIFVDIRPDTLNIDESLIEAAVTQRTRAICAVHYAGVPCEMDTICAIAKKHNLYVIEDAAQGWKLCETLVLSVHFTVPPAQQVSCRHTKAGNWVPSVTLVASPSTTQRT